MTKHAGWPSIIDEALVERMIPAVQRAIVETTTAGNYGVDGDNIELAAPDVANVLLMVLASVIESAPGCATFMGIRLTGEAAGKELALLIRDVRRLKLAQTETGSLQ